MFDEKNVNWAGRFQTLATVEFLLFLLAGIVLGICGWADCFWITDYIFFDGLIFFAAGILLAYISIVVNMTLVQFFNNVQIIREKIEKN